jgi:hypothetical protein
VCVLQVLSFIHVITLTLPSAKLPPSLHVSHTAAPKNTNNKS